MGLTLDDWDEMSRKVPALVAVAPSGPYVLPDMHRKGGVPVVMKKIEKYLDPHVRQLRERRSERTL